ncbi:MAG: GGDEF domain-containing response regulator [Burkholderiales bacterium]
MPVPASVPSFPAAPSSALPPQASRVLLVDDDPLGLMLTATALREHGFEVVEFDRAQDALDAPALEAVDCVVTDALMPDVDGFEFCRRLRSGRRSRAVPVLMLTSLDGDDATRRACEAGATDHCIKSGNWTLLAHRIRQLVHVGRLERERAVVAAVPAAPANAVIRFDWLPAARAVRAGHALFRLLDWVDPPTRVAERRLLAAIDPSDRRVLWRAMARMLAGGPAARMELGVRSRSGRALRLRLDVHQVVTGSQGALEVSGIVRDVTAPEGPDPTVARLGHHDPVTGLPNRAGLLERLARPATPDARGRGAVVVLEIDRFRSMADALGQEAADRLLADVAARLRRFAAGRGSDGRGRVECLASLRGDAFALMLGGLADAGEAVSCARRLADVLDEPFRIGARECFLRASVGVHLFAADEPAPQRLARAELARRAVSSDGGHAVRLFETAMEADGFDRLEMERDLHYALARGEMTLHYQPQVDALDGRVVGFEALMRWTHGGRLQPAARFIPLAEETGLIVPLGDWAVGRACDALAELRARGHTDCTVAVNIAPRQLRSGLVAARVASELAARELDPACLEIELTESGAMGDPETALGELSALRALGVGLAVDDFGTGHSSLAYLTRLPLTTLKIDRAFVQDMTVSERSRAVARTIVALGASLHLRVVAEGVETAEQRDALIALGCTRHQGWLHGRAVPLEEAMAMLGAPRADARVVAEEIRA